MKGKRWESARFPSFEPLEPRLLLDAAPIITEFLADNSVPWNPADPSSDWDWIEIYNPTVSTIDLAGWHLTDDPDDLTQWTFPDYSLAPGAYLVVFASGLDRTDPAQELHTNFGLSKDGEYLALVRPRAWEVDIVSEFDFAEQLEDVSYGVLYDVQGQTELVAKGDAATYRVPSGDALGLSWIEDTFNDDLWTVGTTGLGYGLGVPDGTITLVPKQSVWRYLDNGSNQGTGWRLSGFNDSAWVSGPAELGYGDGGEATVVSFGPDGGNKYITTYFRCTFNVEHAWQVSELTLNLLRDDGAVIYLNGQEIRRDNMPEGAVDYRTPGSPNVGGGDEWTFFTKTIDPAGRLVDGTNVLAVEVHQSSGGSSDVSFDLEVIATTSTAGLLETDVEAAMQGVNASLYVRIPFTVNDPLAFSQLYLRTAYEDGYVAYLNGEPVAVANASPDSEWNSAALTNRPMEEAVGFQGIDLSDHLGLLHAGDNILAIHAMNDAAADETFLIVPELVALSSISVQEQYFLTPTPLAENIPGVLGVVADTQFSHRRGFYDAPFAVTITTDTAGAEIRYTTDGSAPTPTTGTRYTGPVSITTTTALRAMAYKPGYLPTNVDTQTYLFLQDVIQQPIAPAGFPTSWNGEPADYEMDPDIVNNPLYSATLIDDLKAIPTMSLVMNVADVFGPSGIYANPGAEGVGWERAGSIEMFYPEGYAAPDDGFQVDCGVRIYGGVGRNANFKKHAFRLLFKGAYGPTKLEYPLFGEDATDAFDTLVLRHNFNDGYVCGGAAQYIRDEYVRQLQLALGQPSGHGTFVHLYVNGLYWGLYNPVERPDQSFGATYFGGDKDDWDAINAGEATGESDLTEWGQMLNLCRQGLTTSEQYQRLQGNNPDGTDNPAYPNYLDVENYIVYMLVNFFTGNSDWPGHNWYAAREEDPGGTDFTLLVAATYEAANAAPAIGPLVINEIMYHPAESEPGSPYGDEDFEFIELYNRSGAPVDLTRYYLGDGVGFTFGWMDADSFGHELWTLQAGATAAWQADLAAGDYQVLVRWDLVDGQGNPRHLDDQAQYEIQHTGGPTVVVVNQNINPSGWVSLGTFAFGAGPASVTLARGTDDPDRWTIADQVRFVGPTTVVVDDDTPGGFTTTGCTLTTIGPGEYVVVVKNAQAFATRYVTAGMTIAGEFSGNLANGGDKVKLLAATDAEPTGYVPYYLSDYVQYNDTGLWPQEPDGTGFSLSRLDSGAYANDAGNWASGASGGTPGILNDYLDTTPPTVPANVAAQIVVVPTARIELTWQASADPQTWVDHYVVYRDDTPIGTSATPAWTDSAVVSAIPYSYRVSAVNRDGYASALSTALVVAIPGITSITAPQDTTVKVVFSEPLVPASAQQTANYHFDNATVSAAVLAPDGVTVTLTTSELQSSTGYSLTVNNVATLSGRPMPPNLQVSFVYSPHGAGYILREWWLGIGGGAISDLTSNPNYPNNPSGSAQPTIFESPSGFDDNYGTRMRGYVHPPVTGDYIFWIATDDNGQLFLSTDRDPANKVLIASVPGWTGVRQWNVFAEQQSVLIHLEAGRQYYIEALQKEGGGGDNLAVGWKMPGEAVFSGLPIDGLHLSPYVDEATARVDILATDPNAAEEGPNSGMFTVSRTGPTDQALTVYYTAGGTAKAADYTQTLSGQVTIPAGAASTTIPVTPVDDVNAEGDETVILTLASHLTYVIGAAGATVTIVDNDGAPPEATVRIEATDPAAAEDGADTGDFTVSRSGDTGEALTVYYTVGGTADGADYGPALSGQVVLPVGAASVAIVVTPVDEPDDESNETIILTLTENPAYLVDPTADAATVTIVDDDAPPTVGIEATDPAADEEGLGPAVFTVTRVGSTDGPLTVYYGLGGTASAADYTPVLPGQVEILAGEASATITIIPVDDPTDEPVESLVLTLLAEPVEAANAKVTLASGTAATKLSLDSEGRGIIAEFAAPLAAKETLAVTGVTDAAQAPNEMAATKTQVVLPAWPSNRTGVSYLWKNARTRNVIFDEQIGLPITTSLSGWMAHHPPMPARFNRFGAVLATGDMAFELSPGSPDRIMRGIHKTKQFSFEIVVASADLAQTKGDDDKPIAIIDWGFGWRNGIFWLFQEKNQLQVGLSKSWGDPKPEVFEMATLPDTRPHHVIVSWAEKRLAFYLDGKKVKEIDPSPAQLLIFTPPMRFAENAWRGQFEYLAFYNRFIEEDEAAKNAAAVAADLAKRTTLPRIEVQAKLVAKSKLPDPGQMAPYRNALVVNEYEVEKVLKGTYADKTIRVVQWGMLDLKPTPLAAQEPGTSVKLVLETFIDHDELVPEPISDTLKEDFDLKLYTDVNL